MKPNPKPALAKHIEAARLLVVEQALVAFVEEADGKVPTDAEILREGFHVQFAETPLSVYEFQGRRFARYYVWRKQHVLALEFFNPKNPVELTIARVPREEWPGALAAYVEQWQPPKEEV